MDIYKEASRKKTRFQSPVGLLSAEGLWDIPFKDLDAMTLKAEEEFENSKGKKTSFKEKRSTADEGLKLKFEILADVWQTRHDEAEYAKVAGEVREHNKKIDEIIAKKEERNLENKSIAELRKLRKTVK